MKIKTMAVLFVISILFARPVFADNLAEGKQLLADGDLKAAAEFFNGYARSHPNDSKSTPEALALCGRVLDAIADVLTGAAEKKCYWERGGGSPECMQREVQDYNNRYGDGAFRYEHAITYIYYTGSHYKQILERFPKSSYAAESDFYLLLHDLVGHPDIVLPKIKSFLSKYPKGEWNRKGLLLWARVNEDIWYVHRKWSWVLYNDVVATDELIVRAEKYRQEALKTYEKLMGDKNTFEGRMAKNEYAPLKENRDDDVTYSIVNDSIPGTLSKWGIELPTQGQTSSEAPAREPAKQPKAKEKKTEKEIVPQTEIKNKAPSIPKRWQ